MSRRLLLLIFFITPLLAACAPQLPLLTSTFLPAASSAELPSFAREGMASWYGPGFAGRLTANGEIFDPAQLTAAHRTLPFNTHLRVTNLSNGRSVTVRINDRGPFIGDRIIDLSRAAAERIGMLGRGTATVRLEPLSGVGGVLPAAADASLPRWDVVASGRTLGELLLLSSPSAGPVLVRVVGTQVEPGAGAEILLSPELLGEMGPSVSIQSGQ
ncbi:MAG: septal ring lytic transglycosylase RlpA family protein [Trueperaceae bacterium]